eukprot:scaffold15855_cov195-Skeletonema_marinoi.AAC.4
MPISNPAIISRHEATENPNPVTFFDNELVPIKHLPTPLHNESKMTDNISDDQLSQFLALALESESDNMMCCACGIAKDDAISN